MKQNGQAFDLLRNELHMCVQSIKRTIQEDIVLTFSKNHTMY